MDTKQNTCYEPEQINQILKLVEIGVCEYALPPQAFVNVSESWANLLGYTQEQIPRADFFLSWWGQQIYPEHHKEVISALNKLYSGGQDKLTLRFNIKHHMGHWLHVELLAIAAGRDDNGRATRVLTVLKDVSEDEKNYQKIVENLHEGILILGPDDLTRFVNVRMAEMLGYTTDEMLGLNVMELMDEVNQKKCHANLQRRREGVSEYSDYELIHRDGHRVHVTIASSPVFTDKNEYDGVIAAVIDISDTKQQELSLRMLSSAVEQSATMVVITDQDGVIEYVNPRFCDVTGYTVEEVLDQNIGILRSEEIDTEIMADLWGTVTSGENWHGEFHTRKKNGDLYWSLLSVSPIKDEHDRITHYVSVSEDVSQLKEARMKMEQLAYVDSLTGLANRLLFRDRLEQVLKTIQRNHSQAALLYLDLDDFKRINDSMGHDVGDALLMKVAERLRQCVRHQDTVARMGGDEFVILLVDVDGMAGASSVARKIIDALNVPCKLLKHELIVTPSIGITLAPDDSLNADILLKNADMAMYRAKSEGRNNFQFYTDEMNAQVQDRMFLETELRKAIYNDELILKYQPQFHLETGELWGVEALVRWEHPERGLLQPDVFIPVAEDSGLVVELGEWVLRNACREWREMELQGKPVVKLSVNLSARQFRDPYLIGMIQNVLDKSGFKPINLELEITETILMDYLDHAIEILDQIKSLGISVSIDDFGTGYSSLNYLKRLPIDALKIDKSFIRDIPYDNDDMEIASAVIAMAHKLHLDVIAEGLESEAQWTFLKQNQCDIGQGYYLGEPTSAAEFFSSLKKFN